LLFICGALRRGEKVASDEILLWGVVATVRRFGGAQLTRAVEKLVHAYQIKYFLSYFLPLLPLSLLCVDRHNPLGQQQATKK